FRRPERSDDQGGAASRGCVHRAHRGYERRSSAGAATRRHASRQAARHRSAGERSASSMSEMNVPERIRVLVDKVAQGDRSAALALHALISAADAEGCSNFSEAARIYRDDHLAAMRADGRDADREAGRLSLDEVRQHLARSVLPRLVSEGVVILPSGGLSAPDTKIRITEPYWRDIQSSRRQVAAVLRATGEHLTP